MGALGRGNVEVAGLVGKIDVLMGSFSKTFASNGGFVLSRHPALRWFIRYTCNPHTFSNALSPIQAAIVREAFRIVQSDEGEQRRKRLMGNITHLRNSLGSAGFDVLGTPSPIVPVVLGEVAYARVLARELIRLGGIVNLVEYPAVSSGSSRFRLQVMADHTKEHIEQLVERLSRARTVTESILIGYRSEGNSNTHT
jgi:glycine C-acetyltransferase